MLRAQFQGSTIITHEAHPRVTTAHFSTKRMLTAVMKLRNIAICMSEEPARHMLRLQLSDKAPSVRYLNTPDAG